jgi:hypothetical protein
VGGHDQAGAPIGAADDFEQELCSGLGEGDIAKLVEHDQVQAFELGVKALEVSLFATVQQSRYQPSRGGETHTASLLAGGKGQRRGLLAEYVPA